MAFGEMQRSGFKGYMIFMETSKKVDVFGGTAMFGAIWIAFLRYPI